MAPIFTGSKFGFGRVDATQLQPIVYSISCYANFTTQRTISGLDYQRSSDIVPYQDIYGNLLNERGIMYVASGNPVQLKKTSNTLENWIASGTTMTNVGSTSAITGSPTGGVYVTGITGGDRYYFTTNGGYLYSLKIDGSDLVQHSDGVTIDTNGNWQGVCFDPINKKIYVGCYTPVSTIYEFNINMSTGATTYVTKYTDGVNSFSIRGFVYDWRNQLFYVKTADLVVYTYSSMSNFVAATRSTFIASTLASASDTMMYRGYFYDTEYPTYNVLKAYKLSGTDRCV
jgi:hypothetical protein